ncbi:MAG: hypothetical protein OHK0046_31300 [Anaerolineae bacterium]
MANEQSVIDAEIMDLVNDIRDCQQTMADAETRIRELKVRLAELLAERGSNWSDNEGYARLTQEGLRTHYDTDALDELLISDPLRYGWLREYRRQSPVAGRVQVR